MENGPHWDLIVQHNKELNSSVRVSCCAGYVLGVISIMLILILTNR